MDSLTAAARTRKTPSKTVSPLTEWSNMPSVCSPSVCVALRVLGLGSWLVSELRVARGLATGAVERSDESVVQRRVNWRVGPWEKVSNGGKHYKKRADRLITATQTHFFISMTNKHNPYSYAGWRGSEFHSRSVWLRAVHSVFKDSWLLVCLGHKGCHINT